VLPEVTQPIVTQSLTQSTLDFSQPTQRIRTGSKPKESFLKPIRRSAPAANVANATNAANEAVLLRQIQALPIVACIDNSDSDSNGPRPRSRKSYPRELKLSIVQWATSTYITKKDGSKKLITRYEAAKRMDLDEMTLKRWIDSRHKIASQRKNSRRGVNNPKKGQEDILELRLYSSFKAARAIGRQIDRRWFIRHAKAIYREQYPERILTKSNGKLEYLKFKFSNGWFQGFRRRFRISNRCRTKQGQKVPEDFRTKIQVSYYIALSYNRCN
jgi:transposase-like protein